MARKLRHMPYPHALYEISTRTLHARFLLKPSKKINDLVLGIIGRALALHPGIRLYLFKVVSNHYHAIVSAENSMDLSAFMCHINGNIAKEAGRLHQWREKFWSRRFSQIRIMDHRSLLKLTRYIISHGCKENLVSSPEKWPGVGCERALTTGESMQGVWFDRSAFYEAERKGEKVHPQDFTKCYPVPLTPLPFLAAKTETQQQTYYRHLIKEITAETYERLANKNQQVLGVAAVLAQDPHSCPRKIKKSPAPPCHASTAARRKSYRRSYQMFVAAYRWAAMKLRQGDRNVQFPENCFPPPLAFSLPVSGAPPPV